MNIVSPIPGEAVQASVRTNASSAATGFAEALDQSYNTAMRSAQALSAAASLDGLQRRFPGLSFSSGGDVSSLDSVVRNRDKMSTLPQVSIGADVLSAMAGNHTLAEQVESIVAAVMQTTGAESLVSGAAVQRVLTITASVVLVDDLYRTANSLEVLMATRALVTFYEYAASILEQIFSGVNEETDAAHDTRNHEESAALSVFGSGCNGEFYVSHNLLTESRSTQNSDGWVSGDSGTPSPWTQACTTVLAAVMASCSLPNLATVSGKPGGWTFPFATLGTDTLFFNVFSGEMAAMLSSASATMTDIGLFLALQQSTSSPMTALASL